MTKELLAVVLALHASVSWSGTYLSTPLKIKNAKERMSSLRTRNDLIQILSRSPDDKVYLNSLVRRAQIPQNLPKFEFDGRYLHVGKDLAEVIALGNWLAIKIKGQWLLIGDRPSPWDYVELAFRKLNISLGPDEGKHAVHLFLPFSLLFELPQATGGELLTGTVALLILGGVALYIYLSQDPSGQEKRPDQLSGDDERKLIEFMSRALVRIECDPKPVAQLALAIPDYSVLAPAFHSCMGTQLEKLSVEKASQICREVAASVAEQNSAMASPFLMVAGPLPRLSKGHNLARGRFLETSNSAPPIPMAIFRGLNRRVIDFCESPNSSKSRQLREIISANQNALQAKVDRFQAAVIDNKDFRERMQNSVDPEVIY